MVCAREQTAGRGRGARRWHSPAGNLHASILLRTDLPPGRIPQLSLVAALAVADAADAFLPGDVRAELKWPNDVLVRGAKLAGILIESADATAIIGIGMNIAHAPPDAPYPVTTLAAGGAEMLEPAAVLQVLLQALDHRFQIGETRVSPRYGLTGWRAHTRWVRPSACASATARSKGALPISRTTARW